MMKLTKLAKFAWATVAYNIFVVLWGAYVRATGSGAGCGSHWPTCDGEILPRAETAEMAIEFTHRITSGIAFLLVVGLLIWVIRTTTKGEQLRRAAWGAMIFMISESLVGAALVLFQWVAGNISVARVVVQGVHLANTMLLLHFLTISAWLASGGVPTNWKTASKAKWLLLIGFIGTLLLSMAGAVTALGDTLFPAETLAEGIRQDFSPTAHFLVQLRAWHPVLAVAVGLYLYYLARYLRTRFTDLLIRKFTLWMLLIFGIQLIAGALNLILLVPVWMQIVHLFLATLVWIVLTLLSSGVLAVDAQLREELSHE
jgi:heme A synthase